MKKKHIKDPGSAITHFIGMLMAIFAAFPLLIKAAHEPSRIYLISLAIYAVSLIFLYAASTTYHTFDLSERVNTILKKIDHMMIFVLIAGSYTQSACWYWSAEPDLSCSHLYGVSQSPELLSKDSGYSARNGYPPSSTLVWDGSVSSHSVRSSTI